MAFDGRSQRRLLVLAIPGIVLLAIGAFAALQSEQARRDADHILALRSLVETSATHILDAARQSMTRRLSDGIPPEGDFRLAGPGEPLLLAFDSRERLAWPPRRPLLRREDLRSRLPEKDAGMLDVLIHALATDAASDQTRSLLLSLRRTATPPLAAFAGYFLIEPGLDSPDSGGAAGTSPDTEAGELLLLPAEDQIAAHRQRLRSFILRRAVERGDASAARFAWERAVLEILPIGLAEEAVACAWLQELAAIAHPLLPEAAEGLGPALASLRSAVRRSGWLPGRIPFDEGLASVSGREAIVRRWILPDDPAPGTLLVLPPEFPDERVLRGEPGASLRVVPARAESGAIHASLAPLFPEHSLVLEQQSPASGPPLRSILVASFLILGLLIAVFGVSSAFRGVAAREQALAEKSELLTTLSHQLKTPAANLRLFAETLERTPLQAGERRRMESILRDEAHRLQEVLDRVLAYQSTAEPADAPFASIDAGRLLLDRAERWQAAASQRESRIEVDGGTGILVTGDARSLLDALDNLVDNALAVAAANGRVRVSVRRSGGEAVFAIEDDGHGISPEDKPRVFERFYRGRTARARSGGGSGLGLAIVAAVARRHSGSARIAKTEPGCTIMELAIPAEPPDGHHSADRG